MLSNKRSGQYLPLAVETVLDGGDVGEVKEGVAETRRGVEVVDGARSGVYLSVPPLHSILLNVRQVDIPLIVDVLAIRLTGTASGFISPRSGLYVGG